MKCKTVLSQKKCTMGLLKVLQQSTRNKIVECLCNFGFGTTFTVFTDRKIKLFLQIIIYKFRKGGEGVEIILHSAEDNTVVEESVPNKGTAKCR